MIVIIILVFVIDSRSPYEIGQNERPTLLLKSD